MRRGSHVLLAIGALLCASTQLWTALADETSANDHLRMLYSNRLSFTGGDIPLISVELMSGRDEIRLGAKHGVIVRPNGEGGSEIVSDPQWTITVEEAEPARIREWTVVDTLYPHRSDTSAATPGQEVRTISAVMARWRKRGYTPRAFEIGTVFGVEGEVIDSRETLIVIAPVPAPGGRARARAIAETHGLQTRVHRELVRRPRGVIVATDGHTTVRNDAMLWFTPTRADDTIAMPDVLAGSGGSQLQTRRETRRYRGSVYITVGSDGKLTAVNSVPADTLLAGLVPSEIYADAHEEALAAQAIAARTDLLQKIGTRHLTDPYMLCSNQHCQVYSGAGHEHPRTTRAVRATRGQVLLGENGGLADARYSAACGGHGEHGHFIWPGSADAALRGRLDMPAGSREARAFRSGVSANNLEAFLNLPANAGYCGRTRYSPDRYRWRKRVDAATLTRAIADYDPSAKIGRVLALQPLSRGVSGRIGSLRIRGERGVLQVDGDLRIRRLLGGLRSTLFAIDVIGPRTAPTAFVFRGAGFGHGVGMCQLGAIGMAEAGKRVQTILNHYYPGSRIRRLY